MAPGGMLPCFQNSLFTRSPDEFQDELLSRLIGIVLSPGDKDDVCFFNGLLQMPVVFHADIPRSAPEVFGLNLPKLVDNAATMDPPEFRQVLFEDQFFQKLYRFIGYFFIRYTRVLHDHTNRFRRMTSGIGEVQEVSESPALGEYSFHTNIWEVAVYHYSAGRECKVPFFFFSPNHQLGDTGFFTR